MSSRNTSTDPGQLRDEIQQTRADLGETVEDLAAKTNVRGRAEHAAGQLTDQAKDALGEARDQVVTTVRRPVPLVATGIAAVLVALAVHLVRRSRS